ncbi:acyl-CoA thioesterase [Cuneatibacter caecimuris]|uniref:Acyl-CoA hydrolase n=1 Tax=Cuneatibacter caecimuris TaxID=1796618 RepID=A0A4Q7P365_9FIRM|nr:acyl-CoA thioesterase [Cuneatibacter caecimuris]RZS94245.1 acyl-CoA hydrolase [Cuneatibacter caecimuris]
MEKRVEESQTEQTHLLMPQHINGSGRLFGGQLLAWIDETAGIVGRRHSGRDVVTAAIDNLQFKAGAYRNEIIVLIGRVTYTGRTSMEVRVDTYVESPDGMRRPINRAFLMLVAVDENQKPVPVPGLTVETESQKAEWEGAVKRKELHKKRRTEGF